MANKELFASSKGRSARKTDTKNAAGGRAYSLEDKHALSQLVATGCLRSTFYASAKDQLDTMLTLAQGLDSEFLAKLAVYGRYEAYMKDSPALMCAILASREDAGELLERVFPVVIDNGRMLRNFVQIVRSGVTGRKSFGSRPKRLLREWFANRKASHLLRASVGNAPSLADVVKLARPIPRTDSEAAFYAWLIGKPYDKELLPKIVKQYEDYKVGNANELDLSKLPFQLLTALDLGVDEWTEIAKGGGWQWTRMNLNTMQRQGVFGDPTMIRMVAERLRNPELIDKARAFPYQLLMAYKKTSETVPREVSEALQDAMELATKNTPIFEGRTLVAVDMSGSMECAITGKGGWGCPSSEVSCMDVAALFASCILRNNKMTDVLSFDTRVVDPKLNPRDTVMTNAVKLSQSGGGTNCAVVLEHANKRGLKYDQVVYVSDNESWMDSHTNAFYRDGTGLERAWGEFKVKNPDSKLVCIDLVPNTTSQCKDREDVLNVGGFSDQVFKTVADFVNGSGKDGWTKTIEGITLP